MSKLASMECEQHLSLSPVKYGIKIQNTVNRDAGDWSITNSNFNTGSYNADAAIRIEGSGGGKIINVKLNMSPPGGSGRFGTGIDLTCAVSTIILHLQNISIENFTGNCIVINITAGSYRHIFIIGVGIGVPGDASGVAIAMTSHALGYLENIIISNCIFYGKTTGYAINMTNVKNAKLYGNIINTGAFGSGLITEINCTHVTVV